MVTTVETAIVSDRSYHGDVVVAIHFRFAGSFFFDDWQYARLRAVGTLPTSVPLVPPSERLERQSDQHTTHRFAEPEVGRVRETLT